MNIQGHMLRLFWFLAIVNICLHNNLLAQTAPRTSIVDLPIPSEEFSLYDFAAVRFDGKKTDLQLSNIDTTGFQPLKKIFQKDSLYFEDSVQTAWIEFTLRNNGSSDTSVALVFPIGVNKALLYKSEGDKLIFIGKTGFVLAVIARTISYEDNRIDLVVKANSQTNYFVQVPRIGFRFMLVRSPVLENISYAERKAFSFHKTALQPGLLWAHFFTGIFFMFFVFGSIKYLVLGRDRAYLYFALLGLSNAILTVVPAEYPPFELPWFENLRGIELFNLINGIAILMQGLFILEILEIKIKYPRITLVVRYFLFLQLLLASLYTTAWIVHKPYTVFFNKIYPFHQFLLLLLMFCWVWYLATIRKGFYRFIFFGASTILTAFTIYFLIQTFNLFYLLPAWVGGDKRGSVYHFMQIALVIDMCFYFAGLAYRDRQVEKDKSLFQEQLIKQLEGNKALQDKFTRELEMQVNEKTAELMEQSHALEKEKEAKLLADFNRKFSQSELKALRSQMNPHFIFNILNTIESYALENNKDAASEMIQKFSLLTRLVLENSTSQLVPFENDWKSLKLYIELERMRYADKFDAIYKIPDEILTDGYLIPPMIIQPFIENAIIHGLRNRPGKFGKLSLSADLSNDHILVTVEDNGIGREKAALLKKNNPIHKISLGIKVTQDRIAIYNSINQDRKARVEFYDLSTGTRVMIWLPFYRSPG